MQLKYLFIYLTFLKDFPRVLYLCPCDKKMDEQKFLSGRSWKSSELLLLGFDYWQTLAGFFSYCCSMPLFINLFFLMDELVYGCAGSSLLREGVSLAVARGLGWPIARGIFADQGSDQCSLHCKVDSEPLHHQRSPIKLFLLMFTITLLDSTSKCSIDITFNIKHFENSVLSWNGCTISLVQYWFVKLLFSDMSWLGKHPPPQASV